MGIAQALAALVALGIVGASLGAAPALLRDWAASSAPASVAEPAPLPPQGPLGAIVGLVRDWNGEPVQGARVALPAHGLENVTRADGRFFFFAVPEGPAVVRAFALGYESNARTVRVRADTISEVNLRIETATVKPPDVSIVKIDGALACKAAALRLTLLCDAPSDHRVDPARKSVDVVLEMTFDEETAPALNLTASPPGAREPLTSRPARAYATAEGESILRVAFPAPPGAFEASVRYPEGYTGLPPRVAYSVYATIFHDRPAPATYSVFMAP